MEKRTKIILAGAGVLVTAVAGIFWYAYYDLKTEQEIVMETEAPVQTPVYTTIVENTPTPLPTFVSQIEKDDIDWKVTDNIMSNNQSENLLTDKEYEDLVMFKCRGKVSKIMDAIDTFEFKEYNYRSELSARNGKVNLIDTPEFKIDKLFSDFDAVSFNCDVTVVGSKGNKVISCIHNYTTGKDVLYIVLNYDMVGIDSNAEEDYKLSVGTEIYPMLFKDYSTITKVGGIPVIYQ